MKILNIAFFVFLGLAVVLAVVSMFINSRSSEEVTQGNIDEDGVMETVYVYEYNDKVRLFSPAPGSTISNPLVVTGEARGTWFFEADFPVTLLDENEEVLAQWYAVADGEWMTEEYVSFTATIEYDHLSVSGQVGSLQIDRDNPTGKPEHDDGFSIPVVLP